MSDPNCGVATLGQHRRGLDSRRRRVVAVPALMVDGVVKAVFVRRGLRTDFGHGGEVERRVHRKRG